MKGFLLLVGFLASSLFINSTSLLADSITCPADAQLGSVNDDLAATLLFGRGMLDTPEKREVMAARYNRLLKTATGSTYRAMSTPKPGPDPYSLNQGGYINNNDFVLGWLIAYLLFRDQNALASAHNRALSMLIGEQNGQWQLAHWQSDPAIAAVALLTTRDVVPTAKWSAYFHDEFGFDGDISPHTICMSLMGLWARTYARGHNDKVMSIDSGRFIGVTDRPLWRLLERSFRFIPAMRELSERGIVDLIALNGGSMDYTKADNYWDPDLYAMRLHDLLEQIASLQFRPGTKEQGGSIGWLSPIPGSYTAASHLKDNNQGFPGAIELRRYAYNTDGHRILDSNGDPVTKRVADWPLSLRSLPIEGYSADGKPVISAGAMADTVNPFMVFYILASAYRWGLQLMPEAIPEAMHLRFQEGIGHALVTSFNEQTGMNLSSCGCALEGDKDPEGNGFRLTNKIFRKPFRMWPEALQEQEQERGYFSPIAALERTPGISVKRKVTALITWMKNAGRRFKDPGQTDEEIVMFIDSYQRGEIPGE